jgi:electron transfer flavoprotein beta subunit
MNRYIVFLKQVPLSTKVNMDAVTKTLQRSSAACKTNPYDLYALQAALSLRNKTGGEVVAVSMGPPSAEAVLRDAIQRGADRGLLISDIAFAGSDTYCTSLVLAAIARKIEDYSVLLFGRMAIDGDTAQVGPEVAAHLNIPQVTSLASIENITSNTLTATRSNHLKEQQIEVILPCAVIVSKSWGDLQLPNLKGWRRAQEATIERLNAADLGIDPKAVGLLASPTRVVETNVPSQNKEVAWLKTPNEVAEKLSSILNELI